MMDDSVKSTKVLEFTADRLGYVEWDEQTPEVIMELMDMYESLSEHLMRSVNACMKIAGDRGSSDSIDRYEVPSGATLDPIIAAKCSTAWDDDGTWEVKFPLSVLLGDMEAKLENHKREKERERVKAEKEKARIEEEKRVLEEQIERRQYKKLHEKYGKSEFRP